MKKYLLSLFLAIICFCGKAQDFAQYKQNLDWQVYNYPQEKIHVMTDKPYYITGDTIWLRAFVVNAVNNQPVDASKFVYVELISPMNSVDMRVKIKERDGVFKGYLPLDPTKIAEGEYTLTAYTMFMQNQGEQYFFKKINSKIDYDFEWKNKGKGKEFLRVNFQYIDAQTGEKRDYKSFKCFFLSDKSIEWGGGKNNLSIDIKNDDLKGECFKVEYGNYGKYITYPSKSQTTYDVSFYPEGGYLVPGFENRMTFKAMDSNGRSIGITGNIVDGSGNKVAGITTTHDGMGLATFTPQAGITYQAICINDDLGEKSFDLPQVRNDATVLQVTQENKTVKIEAKGSQQSTAMIAVQQRGNLLATGFESVTVVTDTLPAGVVQALLMNNNGRMLSERLFYVTSKQMPNTKLTSNKEEYGNRELVQADIDLSDFVFVDTIVGHLAVSVTDDRTIIPDSTSSILTELLLQSDLQGRINNPAWYFSAPNRNKELDLLMMTQGWRRYDVPHALTGIFLGPKYPIEKGQVLSGTVRSEWRKALMKDAMVKIIAPKIGYGDVAMTDENGRWMVDNVIFPNGTKFVVQATNQKGHGQSNLTIDKGDDRLDIIGIKPIISPFSSSQDINTLEFTYLNNQKQRLQYIEGVANIMLDEIVVTKKKKEKIESIYQLVALKSYNYRYFEKWEINSYDAALQRYPGIRVTPQGLKYRGELVGIYIDGSPLSGWRGPNSSNLTFARSGDVDYLGRERFNAGNPKNIPTDRGQESMVVSNDDSYSTLQMMCPFNIVRTMDFIPPGASAGFTGYTGGVLSIRTKNGTEEGSNRHDYTIKSVFPLGFQRPAEFYAPHYDSGDCGIIEGTDLRETLYWNPSIAINNKQAHFNFYTNDAASTTYTITVEGVTANGELIHATKKITKK